MILDSLECGEPHPDIPPAQRIFEPFIGDWDLRVTWYLDRRVTREEAGEWSFGRVLEGRGVQDVWIVPPRSRRGANADLYEYGTSIRYYSPELDAWRSTWIGPMHDMIRTFIARREGDRIVLDANAHTEGALRWVFSDISQNAFKWRNFINDRGEWRLQQDFRCERRS